MFGQQLQLWYILKYSLDSIVLHRCAYNVACLGVTENDWMVLALEAFEVGQTLLRTAQSLNIHMHK